MENTVNTEVMRIQSVDLDMIHTDNWSAVYQIVSGNEVGYFSIFTDSVTNEGVIMINKVKTRIALSRANTSAKVQQSL